MKKISADNLKTGDILAKDIVSDKGLTVLKKGAVLTNKLIENIKRLDSDSTGVSESYIFIEGNGNTQPKNSEENKEKTEKELSLLEKRFQYIGNNELMEEIKEIIKNVIIINNGGNASL
ncbi:MAG: hypothetical protein ACYCSQ_04560 [bacterium]